MPASRAASEVQGARWGPDERPPRTRDRPDKPRRRRRPPGEEQVLGPHGRKAAGDADGSLREPPLSGAAGRSGPQPPPPLGPPGAGLARPHVPGRVAVLSSPPPQPRTRTRVRRRRGDSSPASAPQLAAHRTHGRLFHGALPRPVGWAAAPKAVERLACARGSLGRGRLPSPGLAGARAAGRGGRGGGAGGVPVPVLSPPRPARAGPAPLTGLRGAPPAARRACSGEKRRSS